MTQLAPVPDPDLITRFADIVGPANALAEAHDQAPYLTEWRDRYVGRTPVVLRPGSVAEVSKILELANETRTAIVPQGGNTGLVGAQIPLESGDEIVISLARLNRIREIDPNGDTMTVEAGVTLANAQDTASDADRLFPLSLGSEGSCQIGGNLATNAGGTAVLAYGNARDLCLGIEVVLADGRVLDGLSKLRKDNTGYDLKDLFVGSEGTLGIITAAVLKLFPKPQSVETAFIAVAGPEAALQLFQKARKRAGPQLTSFELMPRIGIEFCLRHSPGSRDPLSEPSPWYVLAELSSGHDGSLRGLMESILADAFEDGLVVDAALAESGQQAVDFWHVRTAMSEVQREEGGSIKHDVSVPVSSVPAFVDKATAAVQAFAPGCRPVPFGHLGDGNIHFNVSQPVGADKAAYLAKWEAMNEIVHDIVLEFGGSISAEHGIGRMKRDLMPRIKGAVELDLMRALKRTLDPNNILSPGRLLPLDIDASVRP